MNRKEMTCAAVGVVLSATGCSSPLKLPTIPAGDTETAAAREASSVHDAPHITEVLLSLISGTVRDIGTVIFRLSPSSGWSIESDRPRLQVSIEDGHVATITAPDDEKVHFIARVTISHASAGLQFRGALPCGGRL